MSTDRGHRPLWPQYVACYAALAVITVLGILLMQAMVLAISNAGLYFGFYRYTMTVLNQFAFIVLGITWLIAFFWAEHYLRQGIKRGQMWPRVGKVLAVELVLLALAFVMQGLPVS